MGKLATFRNLAPAERAAAFEAMAELGRAAMLVALVRPGRWWRQPPLSVSSDRPDAAVRLVRDAVNRGQRILPGPIKCLPQAIAAQRMLARRGVASAITLATARAPSPGQDRFHAWCKAGERWVTGDCEESDYAVMTPPTHTNA